MILIFYSLQVYPTDLLDQWCDHQPNFVTFVENLTTQQVTAGGDRNHKDADKTAKMNHPDDIEMGINELIQQSCDSQQPQMKHEPEYEKFWFPTPETCQNPELLPQIQRDIYDQILHFQGLEKLEPKTKCQDRLTFIKNFKWENSVLTEDQRSKVEDLLVDFSDIFAKHRFDVGYNSDLKIKLKPEHTTITGDSKSAIKKPGEQSPPPPPPDEKIQQKFFRKTVIQSVEQNVSRSLKKSYDEAIQVTSEDFLPPKYEKIRKSMS